MKTFYHLLGNTTIASITNYTVWFALTYYVYLETQSVFATSIIAGIYLVATSISGFWFGSIVDNHKKKQVMVASSLISLAAYLIGFGIYATAPAGEFTQITSVRLWVMIVVLMSGTIAGNLRNIALPTIVTILFPEEKRDKANGMVGTTSGISFMIVSAISGILVGLAGLWYALLLAIGLSLLTLLHLWFIQVPELGIAHVEGSGMNIDIKGTIKVIAAIGGLFPLIFFTTINNFLGGVFMSLMDPYGLSLVSVETWGFLWALLGTGFIVGGAVIAKWGLGKNPLRSMFLANIFLWFIASIFTIQPSIILLCVGMFLYLCVMPFIEAAEHTIIQKVVAPERQGRVFGFAHSVEQAASPLTAFAIGPLTQFFFIPFMTTGAGVELLGGWFGTGPDRGMALVFTVTGLIGLLVTAVCMNTRFYTMLSKKVTR